MQKKVGNYSEEKVLIGPFGLQADLVLPRAGVREFVLFAHGSGSSRLSPRNRYVAQCLNEAGFGTLLMDLLTPEEEAEESLTGHLRFNIELLADRLIEATDWLEQYCAAAAIKEVAAGYFGASTGAGAALAAAPKRQKLVKAVVSRGGRPDLAGDALSHVKAPTLLIVGEKDTQVISLNTEALRKLAAEAKDLVLVRGATHLFEEPGTLEEAARFAVQWFQFHLKRNEGLRGRHAA